MNIKEEEKFFEYEYEYNESVVNIQSTVKSQDLNENEQVEFENSIESLIFDQSDEDIDEQKSELKKFPETITQQIINKTEKINIS